MNSITLLVAATEKAHLQKALAFMAIPIIIEKDLNENYEVQFFLENIQSLYYLGQVVGLNKGQARVNDAFKK